MNFSELCHVLYDKDKGINVFRSLNSQADCAELLLDTALGNDIDKEFMGFSNDNNRKRYMGQRSLTKTQWAAIEKKLDEERFSKTFAPFLNLVPLADLFSQLQIPLYGKAPDPVTFCTALARQLKAIAHGCGEAADIIASEYIELSKPEWFPDYVNRVLEKYSKNKTLFYHGEERDFEEYYVCSTIVSMDMKQEIQDATLADLKTLSPRLLVLGTSGSGKSSFVQHLILDGLRYPGKEKALPVIVYLRDFGLVKESLFELLVESFHRYDASMDAAVVTGLLEQGCCQILLDGLDEVPAQDIGTAVRQIELLTDQYPKNQVVLFSRPFSSVEQMRHFQTAYLAPFSLEQATDLISNLQAGKEQKESFIQLLEQIYDPYLEYVTNPMLLTLMFMYYLKNGTIPDSLHIFYQQVCDLLIHFHDLSKGYERVFRSTRSSSEFAEVIREFGARSYRKGDFTFTLRDVDLYLGRMNSTKAMAHEEMNPQNFLFDAVSSTCLMREDDHTYSFLHHSIQEYLFADYYSRQSDEILMRLGKTLKDPASPVQENALRILWSFDRSRVERFIFLPLLKDLFSSGDDRKNMLSFLLTACPKLRYTIYYFDTIRRYRAPELFNTMSMMQIMDRSAVLSCLMWSAKIPGIVFVTAPDPKFADAGQREWHYVFKDDFSVWTLPPDYAELGLLKDGSMDHVLKDASGSPSIVATVCTADLYSQDAQSLFIPYLLDREKDPTLWGRYDSVKEYYLQLKNKYTNAAPLDDDDF